MFGRIQKIQRRVNNFVNSISALLNSISLSVTVTVAFLLHVMTQLQAIASSANWLLERFSELSSLLTQSTPSRSIQRVRRMKLFVKSSSNTADETKNEEADKND